MALKLSSISRNTGWKVEFIENETFTLIPRENTYLLLHVTSFYWTDNWCLLSTTKCIVIVFELWNHLIVNQIIQWLCNWNLSSKENMFWHIWKERDTLVSCRVSTERCGTVRCGPEQVCSVTARVNRTAPLGGNVPLKQGNPLQVRMSLLPWPSQDVAHGIAVNQPSLTSSLLVDKRGLECL